MGSRWGKVFFYALMSGCVVWNIFNLFHYGNSFLSKGQVVLAHIYVAVCLICAGWCVFAMVMKYKRDNKRKSK